MQLPDSLESFLAPLSGEQRDNFLNQIDDSDYSVHDWAEALQTFDQWLTQQNISNRPVVDMVDYLHCCATMQGVNIEAAALSEVLKDALDQFGFDAVSDSQ